MSWFRAASIAVALVLLASCVAEAPAPSASSTAVPVPVAIATAEATAEATPSPTPSPSLSSPIVEKANPKSPRPTFSPSPDLQKMLSADPALEALLPAFAFGRSLFRFSMAGSTLATEDGDICPVICTGEPSRFAKALGLTMEQITLAGAMDDPLGLVALAYRAKGARTNLLIPARRAIGGAFHLSWPGELRNLDIAGRSVSFVRFSLYTESGEYLVAQGDVLIILFGPGPDERGTPPAFIVGEVAGIPRP